MKLPAPLHTWQVSAREAIAIQKELASQIQVKPASQPFNFVAGLDAAFADEGKTCVAAAVLWDIAKKEIVEQHVAKKPVHFPYIPGLLSFREGEALLAALSKLRTTPEILMCDGQGLAHPRRLGIASHLSLFTGIPALGCGKSRLIGEHQEPDLPRGGKTYLTHKGEIIGIVLRTKTNTKPIYVSVGNMIDLKTAEQLVLQCFNGYRLPEPTRLADRLVAKEKIDLASQAQSIRAKLSNN